MREAHSEVDPKSQIFFAREARKKNLVFRRVMAHFAIY